MRLDRVSGHPRGRNGRSGLNSLSRRCPRPVRLPIKINRCCGHAGRAPGLSRRPVARLPRRRGPAGLRRPRWHWHVGRRATPPVPEAAAASRFKDAPGHLATAHNAFWLSVSPFSRPLAAARIGLRGEISFLDGARTLSASGLRGLAGGQTCERRSGGSVRCRRTRVVAGLPFPSPSLTPINDAVAAVPHGGCLALHVRARLEVVMNELRTAAMSRWSTRSTDSANT